MEQKKYHSIVRYGHRDTRDVLNVGDEIIIQEKIDGANASFANVDGVLKCWSRNKPLDEHENLGGFYQWAKDNINVEKLLDGVIYFGEWLNPHKVKYEQYVKQFFLYDIYNTYLEEYVSFSMVSDESKRLGLNLIPVFYQGEFESFEQLQSYVGRTDVSGMIGNETMGEGIVVKNVTYRDRFGKQLFVKLVVDGFREIQPQKAPKDPKAISSTQQLVISCLTPARVEKHIFKMIDENFLSSDYGVEDIGIILKHISNTLAEDIIKEEMQELDVEAKQIRKDMSRVLPNIIKDIIKSKQ